VDVDGLFEGSGEKLTLTDFQKCLLKEKGS
jgi:hypothetical protein